MIRPKFKYESTPNGWRTRITRESSQPNRVITVLVREVDTRTTNAFKWEARTIGLNVNRYGSGSTRDEAVENIRWANPTKVRPAGADLEAEGR